MATVRDQPHAIAVCDVDGCEFANLAHWRGERLKLRHMDRSRERKGPQIPSFTSLLGNRHHTKRVNVALRVVAGIAKVPDVHRVSPPLLLRLALALRRVGLTPAPITTWRWSVRCPAARASAGAVVEREATAIVISMTFFMACSLEIISWSLQSRPEKYVRMLSLNVRFATSRKIKPASAITPASMSGKMRVRGA